MIKKIITRTLLLIFITFIIMFFFITTTESGLKLTALILTKTMPGTLQIDRISGEMVGKIHIDNLTYQHRALSINLKTFQLTWSPIYLLTKRLYIDELYTHDLHFKKSSQQKITEKSSQENNNIHSFKLPFNITVNNATFSQLYIEKQNKINHINNLKFSIKTIKDKVIINNLYLRITPYHVLLNGNLQLNVPYTTNITGTLTDYISGYYPVQSSLSIKGDLINQMALQFKITKPFTTELNATVKQALSQGAINVHGAWKDLVLPIGDYGNIASQFGKLNISGTLELKHGYWRHQHPRRKMGSKRNR